MRRTIHAVIATALMATGLLVMAGPVMATKPDPEHKVTICHRTASDTNPYVFISVDVASLPAHLNNLPGHPAKEWKSDGTFRGVPHKAGDLKNDYVATEASECEDFSQPSATPSGEPSSSPVPSASVDPTPSVTPEPSSTPTPTSTPSASPTSSPTFQPTTTVTPLSHATPPATDTDEMTPIPSASTNILPMVGGFIMVLAGIYLKFALRRGKYE